MQTPIRHFTYFTPRLPTPLLAMAFSACFAAATLFAVTAIGQPAVLAFIGLGGLLVLLFPHMVYQANVRNLMLWCYPLWILFSVNWSPIPDRTLHTVLLLLPTILVGISLGGIQDRRAVTAGAAITLSLYMAYSLAVSAKSMFSDTGSGGTALTGLSSGKNFYGHISAMSLLMAPSLFSYAKERYGGLMIMAGAAGMAVSAAGLWGSHATGSMLSALIGFATYPAILLFRRMSWQWRIVLLAATLGVIVIYLVFGEQLKEEIFNAILKTFNKDTSLTGRTVLWDYGDRLIAEHRMLGYGYGAFWHYTNPDAWTLWRMMGVPPMSGFNFHNTFRETLIDSGVIGLAIFLGTLGFAFVRTGWRALMSGEFIDAVRFAFIVYFVVRMPVESTGLGSTTIDTVLLLAFLSTPPVAAVVGSLSKTAPARNATYRRPFQRTVRSGPKLRTAD